jgi:hypothetical protein
MNYIIGFIPTDNGNAEEGGTDWKDAHNTHKGMF